MKTMKSLLSISLILALSLPAFAQSSISKDLYIDAGEKSDRKVHSVSGDVVIGKRARIQESVSTVSGDIEIGAKAEVGPVETVSGDIDLAKGAEAASVESVSGDIHLYGSNRIHGKLKTVSGDITAESGSKIDGLIITVSGDIELDDSRVQDNLQTVSGDIDLYNGSVVNGDIIINRKRSGNFPMGRLEVVIDLNSVVRGSIRVLEEDTNVKVHLSNGGKVEGQIINAEVIEH